MRLRFRTSSRELSSSSHARMSSACFSAASSSAMCSCQANPEKPQTSVELSVPQILHGYPVTLVATSTVVSCSRMVESRRPRAYKISAAKHFSSRRRPKAHAPFRCACGSEVLLPRLRRPARACTRGSEGGPRRWRTSREYSGGFRSACGLIRRQPRNARTDWPAPYLRGADPEADVPSQYKGCRTGWLLPWQRILPCAPSPCTAQT